MPGRVADFVRWRLHSVDISADHLREARAACGPLAEYVEWHAMRSDEFLRSFRGRINILYLDGVGWHEDGIQPWPEFASQQQHRQDFVLARECLDGAVGVDDTDGLKWGKGALIAAFLEGRSLPWKTVYCRTRGGWPCGIVAPWRAGVGRV
jgi:hypothetical protein